MISVYVVRNDRIIINTVSGFYHIAFFAVTHFNDTFHYINELFSFVRRKGKLNIVIRSYINNERFHMAVGFRF